MAKPDEFSDQRRQRQNRYFSNSFKKERVREIERNLTTVTDISREYEVTRAAVYKWIYKFSLMRKKGVKQVVELLSDTKKIQMLKDQVKELEQIVGQKQIQIEFQEKMIELAEEKYQVDIKKKTWFATIYWFWQNREKHDWKMNEIYTAIGTTKQNIHQRLNHQLEAWEEQAQLLVLMRQIREDHPQLGARTMYDMIRPQTMGRDSFIEFYNESGLKLKAVKNYRRTTNSSGVIHFPNLVIGFELTGVNQVWVSDITYFELNGRFCYLTFIMDLFSRKIKGYVASKSLRTIDTTIAALTMALIQLQPGEQPIVHSDGGGQYYCKEFLDLTNDRIKNSMCESVYENAHAERVNGTIKNDYLIHYAPDNFDELKKMLDKAVKMYNNYRPHQGLKGQIPEQFDRLHRSYPQNGSLSTKEKRSKKENINNNNNSLFNKTSKTVNLI